MEIKYFQLYKYLEKEVQESQLLDIRMERKKERKIQLHIILRE